MHALQILGSFAVVAAFASCAFDNGTLRWASLALLACVLGTVIEFVLGAWPLGLAAAGLAVVAGRRWLNRTRGKVPPTSANDASAQDLQRHT